MTRDQQADTSGDLSDEPGLAGLDRDIVEILSKDGRLSFAELGRRLGHSTSTMKRRVEALQRHGVIVGFTAVTAHADRTEAVVEVFCRGNVPIRTLAEHFAAIPHVTSAVAVAGMADAVVMVRTRNNVELGEAIERIRDAPFIERTRTSIVLDRLRAEDK